MADYGKARERRWRERVEADAKRPDDWAARTARRLGLRAESTGDSRAVFRGRFAGSAVDVVRAIRTIHTWEWTVSVSRAGLDSAIVLDRETAITRAKRALGRTDVETGADGFDDVVWVAGDSNHMLGALDEATRVAVLDLVARGGRLRDGAWRFTRRTNEPEAVPERLVRDYRAAAKISRRLAAATNDARRRMIENARNERNLSVRIANLDRLRAAYRDDLGRLDWRIDQAVDPRVAWRTALMSRRTTTWELARWAASPDLATRDRAAFLELLDRRLPDSEALGGLEDQMHGPLAGAALRLLMKRVNHAPTVRDLRPPTLVALMTAASTDERIRLVQTLGKVGRTDAVPLLVPYASGLFHPRALKDAVRRAIARIEDRTNRHRGHLSVTAAPDAGRLSVATEGGDLSMVDD